MTRARRSVSISMSIIRSGREERLVFASAARLVDSLNAHRGPLALTDSTQSNWSVVIFQKQIQFPGSLVRSVSSIRAAIVVVPLDVIYGLDSDPPPLPVGRASLLH